METTETVERVPPKFARTAAWIVILIFGAALLMEVPVLNPASGGGGWSMLLCGAATIIWALGAVRNHPIRSNRDVLIFVAIVIGVGVSLNLGIVGGMVLLTGCGLGMLASSFGTSRRMPDLHNPYRNYACRILLGVSAITMLAHLSRIVFLLASRMF
jgi:hypothetical protein